MDKAKFFARVRTSLFGGSLTQSQVEGMELLLDEVPAHWPLDWLANALATVYLETGRKFEPISENLYYTTASRIREVWPSRFVSVEAAQPYTRNPQRLANEVYNGRMGNRPSTDDGWNYRGRGFVQITGYDNYKRMGKLLSIDLVNNPSLALEAKTAAKILFEGMERGLFTGKALRDFDPWEQRALRESRRIINGLDRADDLREYHMKFRLALTEAGYRAKSKSIQVILPGIDPPPSPSGDFWRKLGALIGEWLRKLWTGETK